jgi:hypothetical protein
MGDDYLWDRSGEPDPEIARLERTLGRLRHAPEVVPLHRRPRARWLALAAAAALLLATVAVFRDRPKEIAGPAFRIERLEGTPRVEAAPVASSALLGVGQWLTTDDHARARIAVAGIGVVEVAAGSRVRLAATGPAQHRLDLARGTISARVDAPPRLFVVGTPAATAVDLGCAYTLSVDDRGHTLLRVTSGWVSLEDGGRASLVVAGASCETRPGAGPGTPALDDAPAPLKDALGRLDFSAGGADAIRAALAAARPEDALTVWHLIARADPPLRAEVVARLRIMHPPPEGVREAEVERLDPEALARWRDAVAEGPLTTW